MLLLVVVVVVCVYCWGHKVCRRLFCVQGTPTPASVKKGDESENPERPDSLELEGEPVGATVRMCCASQLERE